MASTQLCCKRPKGKAAIRPNKIAVTVSRFMARLAILAISRKSARGPTWTDRCRSNKLGQFKIQIGTNASELGQYPSSEKEHIANREQIVYIAPLAGRSLSVPRIRSYKEWEQ